MSELVADMAQPDPPRSTNETQSTASNRPRESWDRQNYNQSRNEYNEEYNRYDEFNRQRRGIPMPVIYVNTITGSENVSVTQNVSFDNNAQTKQKHKVHVNKKQHQRILLYFRQLAGVNSNLTNADKLKIKFVVKDWKKLAKKLGFEGSVRDQHSKNCRGEKIDEIVYKLIIIWEQRTGRAATVGKLAEALWLSYEYDAVEKLAENYGYGSTAE